MLKMGEWGRVDRRKDMVWAQQGFKDTSVTMFTSEGLLLDGDKKKKKRSSQTFLSYRGSLNVQLVFWPLVDREEAQRGRREFKSEDILLASGHRGPEGRFCNCWPQRRQCRAPLTLSTKGWCGLSHSKVTVTAKTEEKALPSGEARAEPRGHWSSRLSLASSACFLVLCFWDSPVPCSPLLASNRQWPLVSASMYWI